MTKKLITLKIGRHTYDITESDRFIDNGIWVQLTTQNKQTYTWDQPVDPVLSKKSVKQIGRFTKLFHDNDGNNKFFSLNE